MKHKFLLVVAILITLPLLKTNAQEKRFFMPKEIRKAYEKGTRSYDGKPGEKYWDNFVDYNIKANIVPEDLLIEGSEKVTFKNGSPDKLNTLVVRLYADVYKKGNGRAWGVDTRDLHDGVELSDVKINGVKIDLENKQIVRRSGTNISFTLSEPLEPGKELTFETSWKQKIQHSNIRTGVCDSTSFFIAYWYPQISVYDDIFGWDRTNFFMNTEIYNNLGNFDVEISAPDSFFVWATGTFENAKKVLSKDVYKRFEEAKKSKEKVNIITEEDHKNGLKTLSNKWHYTAKEVTDFAFAISDHYMWDAAYQEVEGRKVLINSVYPIAKAQECTELTDIQQKTMKYFSEDVPGVAYPYEAFTSVVAPGQGGGGMEFPMMANNGSPSRGLTVHEMFHTYFPMYVRMNERKWAFIDEGWATYNTAYTEKYNFDGSKDIQDIFSDSKGGLSWVFGSINDMPLFTNSDYLKNNYGYMSYSMPGHVYTILHHYLGDDTFKKCYKEFVSRWAKKAPTPYDMFYTFENVSGEDLAWLWKPWFFEFGDADVELGNLEKGKLTIKKHGSKPVPVFVTIKYNDGKKEVINKNAKIWADGKSEIKIEIPNVSDIKMITVNDKIADLDPENNFYPSIKEITAKSKISKGILGKYKTNQFPALAEIIIEEGLYYFAIADFDMKELIYPVEEKQLNTIDNGKTFTFVFKEDACTGVDINWQGWPLKAEKVED